MIKITLYNYKNGYFCHVKTSAILFSFILSTLILFNSLRVSFTYTYYELDPVGFIEKLCENKDKPELQCNGKCHLKKVSESQSSEQKTPESIIDFKELILYSCNINNFSFLNRTDFIKKLDIEYLNLYSYSNLLDTFRPPKI